MKRTREYRRSVAKTHIAHKKWICRYIRQWDWYDNDNQYSKNKVHCSCYWCGERNAYYNRMLLSGVNDKFKDELEEAGLNLVIPNRINRNIRHYVHHTRYSRHWN